MNRIKRSVAATPVTTTAILKATHRKWSITPTYPVIMRPMTSARIRIEKRNIGEPPWDADIGQWTSVKLICSTLPTSVRQKWKTISALTCGYSRTIGGMLLAFAARKVGSNTLIHRYRLIGKITLYIIDSFEAINVSTLQLRYFISDNIY